ncbi:MAG: hypothetical protein ACI837_002729 [Crocinitomicaceae bacterium]|jgi:hypothetical protein
MGSKRTKAPIWFCVIAIIALLWNLMGVASFFQHIMMSDEVLNLLPEAEQELFKSYPLWTQVAFGFAVFGGAIGAIGLVARKKWSKLAFIVSLVGSIPQMTFALFFTNTAEVYGPGSVGMPISIIVFGLFVLWFSAFGIRKGWLN